MQRTGCVWRLLPTGFPAWTSVYKSFERWAAADRFEQMRDWLRAQWRERLGRHGQLTAAVLDSQTTRHSSQGGEAGFDAGKKIRGRKRHLLVDTRGLLLAVTVTGHMGCACSGVRRARHCVVKCVLRSYGRAMNKDA